MVNLRNSVMHGTYFLTYTLLNINSNVVCKYSCAGGNSSLAHIQKDWSDICCFACSFRNEVFHLAAILIRQMQWIFTTPKNRMQMHSFWFLSKSC